MVPDSVLSLLDGVCLMELLFGCVVSIWAWLLGSRLDGVCLPLFGCVISSSSKPSPPIISSIDGSHAV